MCFLEFVGYTCGHTSLPVLRACPLTTASHTFPTCPRRADKPFLAGEMCSACQKIVHSRATQIEEYEHRFMHERGACGCDTVFPYLIRPRIIGSCGGGGDDIDGGTDVSMGEDGVEATDDPNGPIINTTNEPRLPPLMCEATDAGGRAVVSVRLPSLYAAEWVADHRARHDAGLCHCRIDFRTYQQALRDAEAEAHGDAKDGEPHRPLRRALSTSSLPCAKGMGTGRKGMHVRSESHCDFSYFMSEKVGGDDKTDIAERQNASRNEDIILVTVAGTERSEGSSDRLAPSSVGPTTRYLATPPFVGRAVRYAGAVFTEVPTYLPLTGPFLAQPSPYARDLDQPVAVDGILEVDSNKTNREVEEKEEHGKRYQEKNWTPLALLSPRVAPRQSQAQAVASVKDHCIQQARTQDPLVGSPLGAGPEGVSHAMPWRNKPPCWRQS